MPQQDPGGNIGVEPDPVVIGPQPGPGPVAGPIGGGFSPDVEVVQPMPPPSPPQMINIDDSPDVGPRMMGLPGVSIASDFMPLVNSTRSRLLELIYSPNTKWDSWSLVHIHIVTNTVHVVGSHDGPQEDSKI